MLDMPLRDMVMLSSEEASTQNTCDNLLDTSSINFRQIWVFPIPPVPQRRQERLINLPSAQWIKIFQSLLSASFRPINSELEFGFWGTGIFICLSLGLAGRILFLDNKIWTIFNSLYSHKKDLLLQKCHQWWVHSWGSQGDPSQNPESGNCQQRARANSLSNSQRDFVPIPWVLALWH